MNLFELTREDIKASCDEEPIIRFFDCRNLPLPQREAVTAWPFVMLAAAIVKWLPRNAERSVALRKLLEARDAAVRASALRPLPDETAR